MKKKLQKYLQRTIITVSTFCTHGFTRQLASCLREIDVFHFTAQQAIVVDSFSFFQLMAIKQGQEVIQMGEVEKRKEQKVYDKSFDEVQ